MKQLITSTLVLIFRNPFLSFFLQVPYYANEHSMGFITSTPLLVEEEETNGADSE